jgi:hypothetical protein
MDTLIMIKIFQNFKENIFIHHFFLKIICRNVLFLNKENILFKVNLFEKLNYNQTRIYLKLLTLFIQCIKYILAIFIEKKKILIKII